MLLAIDTSTRMLSLAYYDGTDLLFEHSQYANNRHSEILAPTIANLCNSCGIVLSDIMACAVAIGPGSYTGVRIGVAFAKGLALAQKLPIIGMTTLDILAAGHPPPHRDEQLVTILQAGRGRIIAQSYHWEEAQWQSLDAPSILEWRELLEGFEHLTRITGEIDDQGFEAIEKSGKRILITSSVYRMRRAGFLATLAWEQLRNKSDEQTFDANLITPLYLQAP